VAGVATRSELVQFQGKETLAPEYWEETAGQKGRRSKSPNNYEGVFPTKEKEYPEVEKKKGDRRERERKVTRLYSQ